MRILLVNYEFPPLGGGAANATMFIARALTHLGHQVSVLTTAFGDLAGPRVEDGVRVHRVRARRAAADRSNPCEMASFVGASLRPARYIARECATEAVIVFFSIPSGPVGWFLDWALGLPYVVSLRGGDVPGLVPELDRVHRLIKPIRRAVLRRARAIIANSDSLARLSEKTDPFPVGVIPNGVDTDYFHARALGERPDGDVFRILFVGRLTAQKNLPPVLEALARLRRDLVREVVLDIVGDGPLRREWDEMSRGLGLARAISWHGWLPKERVATLYRRASCFVNPSLYEGMPNTVLEAMASGLPVIASNVGGNDALVRHGKTGFLVELTDPNPLERPLAALIGDGALGARLGAAGRTRVVADFSWVRSRSDTSVCSSPNRVEACDAVRLRAELGALLSQRCKRRARGPGSARLREVALRRRA